MSVLGPQFDEYDMNRLPRAVFARDEAAAALSADRERMTGGRCSKRKHAEYRAKLAAAEQELQAAKEERDRNIP